MCVPATNELGHIITLIEHNPLWRHSRILARIQVK